MSISVSIVNILVGLGDSTNSKLISREKGILLWFGFFI